MKKLVVSGVLIFSGNSIAVEIQDKNYLRHLQEGWPEIKEMPVSRIKSFDSKVSRTLRGRHRSYIISLQALESSLIQAEKSDCQRIELEAVQSLLKEAQKNKTSLTLCEKNCREANLLFQKMNNLVVELDYSIENCLRGPSLKPLLANKKSQFNGFTSFSFFNNSNPSTKELQVLAGLQKDSRKLNYWNSLDLEAGLPFRSHNGSKLKYRFADDWIYQPSQNSLQLSGMTSRDFSYLNSSGYSINNISKDKNNIGAQWKFPLSDYSMSLGLTWEQEYWQKGMWVRNQLQFNTQYYLMDRYRESMQLYVSTARISLNKNLSKKLWVTRLGFAFEEKRSIENASILKIGLQDRRVQNSGASIWPEFELMGKGEDLILESFYPSWLLRLRPVETPWAVNTLRMESQMGLKYKKNSWSIPFMLGAGRDFHRSDLETRRDDLLLSASLAPSYKFNSGLSIELPMEWQHFWVLNSKNPNTLLNVAYPQNAFQVYELGLRVNYEF